MKRIFAIVAALCLALTASADEGMWLLPLLQKMNGKALKEAGCKLSPEDIYSINHSSLKDAVIHFGGGCTGEIISAEGLIVTTPQPVALADVEKGVNMFRTQSINRPIFGLVENMAWFTPEEHPDEKYYIFGKDGGTAMAERFGIGLLGQIPLVQSIREAGDNGEPVALGTRPDSLAFLELARKLVEAVNKE